jgi:hypothetical protein
MKNILFYFFISINLISFSQSWHAEKNGDRFQLTKNSTGNYTLRTKFEDGSISVSKITRYAIRYDNPNLGITMRTASSDEYCNETIISGGGEPWPKVILSWYRLPDCFGPVCRSMTLIIDDGFDIRTILFFED